MRRLHPTTLAPLWSATIDNCFWDTTEDLAVSATGDVLVVGSTRAAPFPSETDFYVRRYSPSGAMRWQARSRTGVGETGLAIAIDAADDSAVITGAVTTEGTMSALFSRVSARGVLGSIASLSFSETDSDVGRAIVVHPDRQVSLLSSATHARLARLTSAGARLWAVELESGAPRTDGMDLAAGAGGEVFALTVGVTLSSSTTQVPNVFRYKATGARIWKREIVLNSRRWHPAHSLVREASGSLLVAGEYAVGLGPRPWLQRLTTSGGTAMTRLLSEPNVNQVMGLGLRGTTSALLAASPASTGATLIVPVPL